jgi:tripartite-type tricarboxylate transporter receptor subunit TctC
MTHFSRLIGAAVAALVVGASLAPAMAQSYPDKPVKLVIPFPPGGTTDIVGRILAQRLGEALGKPFVVENKPGAGGIVGTDYVAKAAPDGYTLLLGNSGALASGITLFPSIPYNVSRDFAPISMITDVSIVLAVNPKLPVKTVGELVAYTKAHPAQLNVALPSVGSMHHLLTEQFKISAGMNFVTVPYKGSGPAVLDLIGDHVQMDFDNLPALAPHIQSGQVRALAVADAKRSEFLPDVPSMKEAGYPDIVASPWFAMMAPSGTPRPIIDHLNRQVVKIMQSEDMKQKLREQGANARWSTPEECGAFIRSEIDRWAKVVKMAGVKLD